jgi:tetratricopeptide (TPR) repeat protein
VGLEFVSQGAPDRLVRTDDERRETPRPGQVRTPTRATPVVPIAPIGPTPLGIPSVPVDRRRHSRIAISVDVQLRWLAPDGSTKREERTVADNVSRAGARVLTSITEMRKGDRVALREIGADFETDAIVRNTFVGKDNIPRVGVEFVGKTAPDRLLPTSENEQRTTGRVPRAKPPQPTPAPPTQQSAPTTPTPPRGQPAVPEVPAEERRKKIRELHSSLATMNHFEFLGLDRRARESDVKQAYVRMARQYHPDAARDPALADVQSELSAIFLRLSEAYEVLRDAEKRGQYESRIGRKPSDRMSPPSVTKVSVPSASDTNEVPPPAPPPPPAPETDEDRSLRIESTLRTARRHLAGAEYWEVIRLLEPLVDQTAGTRLSVAVRLTLGQALAKNPNWLKRAEELVVGAVRDEPKNADGHFLLGTLYRQAGLGARARSALRKALELDPTHAGAAAELEAMEAAPKGRGR